MKKLVFAILGLAFLCGCQTTSYEPIPLGSTVTDSFNVGGKRVPLPSGEWTVTGSSVGDTTLQNTFLRSVLVQTNGDTLTKMVFVSTNLDSGFDHFQRKGWVESSRCKRTNMLFVKVYENEAQGNQDCWGINHRSLRFTKGDKAPYWEETRKYIARNKLKFPTNTVDVFFQVASETDYLLVYYYNNPEISGIPPSKYPGWAHIDWNRDRIHLHPDKEASVEELKAWGAAWHTRVKRGFAKNH